MKLNLHSKTDVQPLLQEAVYFHNLGSTFLILCNTTSQPLRGKLLSVIANTCFLLHELFFDFILLQSSQVGPTPSFTHTDKYVLFRLITKRDRKLD